jgi:hypothetical protein
MHVLHRVWIGGLAAPVGQESCVHTVFGIPYRHFSRSGVWGSVWNVVQGGSCGGMHSGRADSRCSHSVPGLDLGRPLAAPLPRQHTVKTPKELRTRDGYNGNQVGAAAVAWFPRLGEMTYGPRFS